MQQYPLFPKHIRSFVRRERAMSEQRYATFQEYWQLYGLNSQEGEFEAKKVFNREGPTILEIGFGDGEALLQGARANPQYNYLGIEVYRPGVELVLHTIERENLHNIRVYSEDALQLLQTVIPKNSFEAILLFFPDPWPKRCHHKRRLVRPLFLDFICNKLKDGGYFHFATDWQNYYEQVLKLITNDSRFKIYSPEEDHLKNELLIPFMERPSTKFERAGIAAGRGIYDIIIKKV